MIDETLAFIPVNIALLTVSDTRNASNDKSGDKLADLIGAAGHKIVRRQISARDNHLVHPWYRFQ